MAALFSNNKSIVSFLVSCRQPNVIDVEVMYDHVPIFTQEKKKTNYKPTVLRAVLINKNIPSHKHTFKYYIHGYFLKKYYSEKSYSASMGAHTCDPRTQKAAVGELL